MIVNRVPKGKSYPVCVLLTQSVRYLGFWLAQHSTYTIVKTHTHTPFSHTQWHLVTSISENTVVEFPLDFSALKKGN